MLTSLNLNIDCQETLEIFHLYDKVEISQGVDIINSETCCQPKLYKYKCCQTSSSNSVNQKFIVVALATQIQNNKINEKRNQNSFFIYLIKKIKVD